MEIVITVPLSVNLANTFENYLIIFKFGLFIGKQYEILSVGTVYNCNL